MLAEVMKKSELALTKAAGLASRRLTLRSRETRSSDRGWLPYQLAGNLSRRSLSAMSLTLRTKPLGRLPATVSECGRAHLPVIADLAGLGTRASPHREPAAPHNSIRRTPRRVVPCAS